MEELGRMDKREEEALLKAYSQTTGKSVAELRKILEQAKEEAKALGITNDNVIKGKFRRKIASLLISERTGRPPRKEPVTFKGFLLGADTVRDIKEQMRRKALKIYDAEGENAILEGYVDENGTPLDWRPTIKNRYGIEVDNPNYHKPIVGHQYVRDIFGIVQKEGDTEPKLFVMTLWGGFATSFTYRPFVPVEFRATIKSDNPYYILNMPRLEKGQKLFKTISMDIDCQDWIRRALKDRTYSLRDLSSAVKATRKAKDPWILVEGLVDSIDTEINPKTGNRTVMLSDPDIGMTEIVRVFIPKDFPLGFREFTRVLVFGKPKAWKREDETEERYSINGISIYPIPGQTVEIPIEEQTAAEAVILEEEEEGWDLWG